MYEVSWGSLQDRLPLSTPAAAPGSSVALKDPPVTMPLADIDPLGNAGSKGAMKMTKSSLGRNLDVVKVGITKEVSFSETGRIHEHCIDREGLYNLPSSRCV